MQLSFSSIPNLTRAISLEPVRFETVGLGARIRLFLHRLHLTRCARPLRPRRIRAPFLPSPIATLLGLSCGFLGVQLHTRWLTVQQGSVTGTQTRIMGIMVHQMQTLVSAASIQTRDASVNANQSATATGSETVNESAIENVTATGTVTAEQLAAGARQTLALGQV